jgi:hypothetical protein
MFALVTSVLSIRFFHFTTRANAIHQIFFIKKGGNTSHNYYVTIMTIETIKANSYLIFFALTSDV